MNEQETQRPRTPQGSANPRAQASGKGAPLGHLPTIDGLRGIAIILVLWYHGPFVFQTVMELPTSRFWRMSTAGWIGVDLFFVVSGLLITSILLRTRDQIGQLRTFWARRALRILPLGYFYLVVLMVLGSLSPVMDSFAGWPFYFAYLGNVHIALNGFQPLPVMILWSLAVEEQFYLLWPFVVRFLEPRRLMRLCLLVAYAAPLARIMVAFYPAVYVLTFCRADALAVGALLALLLHDETHRAATLHWCRRLVLPALLTLGFVVAAPFGPSFSVTHPWGFTVYGYSLIAVAFAILVGASLESKGWVRAVLTSRLLMYVGKLCYGYYIWHCLVGTLLQQLCVTYAPGMLTFYEKLVLWVLSTTLVATASWYLFERPFLNLKRWFPHAAQSGAAACRPPGIAADQARPSDATSA